MINKNLFKMFVTLACFGQLCLFGCGHVGNRHEISLNGVWKLAKTEVDEKMPTNFNAEVQVPGLVDLCKPSLDEKNAKFENSLYWYKKKFVIKNIPDIARLKINKAKYHTKVYLNGQFVGENLHCFSPTELNIKPYLNKAGMENELVVCVGCYNNLPKTVIRGLDWEKNRYIPGIDDDVKLILSGYPFISNIQIAPNIDKSQVRVAAELEIVNRNDLEGFDYVVKELVTGKVVAKGEFFAENKTKNLAVADFIIDIPNAKLWSPESPFLYELFLKTCGDDKNVRFGMRSFSTDPERGVVLLNGRPYYMRGTNICLGRFIEDSERADLPWKEEWIIRLYHKFKEMHWNSIRYSICCPPERWYEIADSLGFLIQDEYPIWTGWRPTFEKVYEGLTAEGLASEYREWMQQHWNHPCVVIWDASNESITETTGKAIQMVRPLDLSDRPWDNSWEMPTSKFDLTEAHPYVFGGYLDGRYHIKGIPSKHGVLYDHLTEAQFNLPDEKYDPSIFPNSPIPAPDGVRYSNPIIINEYGWLWLNRDGSPTILTKRIYEKIFPEASTPEKRKEIYARNLGMLTEYWRMHRTYAGVLHFCALTSSRPNPPYGATSDNFSDIINLKFDKYFLKYVKPAFNPIGIMLDFWDLRPEAGSKIVIPVKMINDNYDKVSGTVKFSMSKRGCSDEIFVKEIEYSLEGLDKQVYNVAISIPDELGEYMMKAVFTDNGETISSVREFVVE